MTGLANFCRIKSRQNISIAIKIFVEYHSELILIAQFFTFFRMSKIRENKLIVESIGQFLFEAYEE